jgi:hypothetical protein
MNRLTLIGGAAALSLAAGVLGVRLAAAGGGKPVGVVSLLVGAATRSSDDGKTWQELKQGAKVNDDDGSMLRLGPSSELKLQDVKLDKKDKRKKQVKTKLFVGRMWAAVTSLFGSDSEFEVTTENAVAGVRGTRFSAEAASDGSTLVKVYDGKVLISNKPIYAVAGHTKGKRVEVAGPAEISKKQWEELVASAMQQVKVAAGGAMSQENFQLAENDDWEKWNQERDQLAGLGEQHQ